MKLSGSLLFAVSVAYNSGYESIGYDKGQQGRLPFVGTKLEPMRGACMDQRESKMLCATECEMKNLGRKVVRMALQGESTWQYQVIGTEKSKDAATSDYKQIFVLNETGVKQLLLKRLQAENSSSIFWTSLLE